MTYAKEQKSQGRERPLGVLDLPSACVTERVYRIVNSEKVR